MECPNCGRTNPAGIAECSRCGAPLAQADARTVDAQGGMQRTLDLSDLRTAANDTPAAGEARPSAPALRPGQMLGERYEILSVIGEGGCGIVYKAHDRALDRTVALKTIHPTVAANPGTLERFKREILLASKISHGNVVRIHDLGQAGDLQFISMAFIEGVDLKELIRRKGRFDVEEALPLIRQLACALRAAHEAGVVHRDLKPQNVLVDSEGTAYVGDFGISRSLDHGQTMTEAGAVLGTLSYMSPEQARGQTLDHRSDIYSLGLIIYEMFAGGEPFETESPVSALMKRVEEDVPAIGTMRSDLPPWICRIIGRCLERDVDDRYQNVDELIRDLDRHKAGRVIHRSTARRLWIAAAVLIVLGAVVFAGLRLWKSAPAVEAAAAPVKPVVRASLTIVPFRNVTDDAAFDWIRDGLPELLRSELRQQQGLRLAGGSRVTDVVENLQLGRDGVFGEDAVLTVARLTAVENVLSGELIKIGDRFRIDAHLLRIGAAAVAQDTALRAEGQGAESLFTMVDELTDRVREELGLDRAAGAEHRSAAELSTASVEALRLYSEGSTLARAGSDLEAAARLEQALVEDPEFGLASALLAETYARLGRADDALAAADRASAALSRVSPYEAARIRGVRAYLAGDLDGAVTAYRELASLAPSRADAHVALASVLEETGELDAAKESLDEAIRLDPKNPAALFSRGRAQAKRGEAGSAIEDFNAALALHIDSGNDEGRATVLNGLGNIYRALGEGDLALRNYEESLQVRREIGARRGVAAVLRNISLIHFDRGEFDLAIESQEEGLAVSEEIGDEEGRAFAYANLGDLYAAAGRAERALEMYQQSLDVVVASGGDDAAMARAKSNLGYIYTVLGRYNEAFMFQKDALDARRALGEKLDVLFSLMDIGNLELVQGRFDDALAHYNEGLGLAREVGNQAALVVFGRNVGIIRRQRGEYAAALASIEKATDRARTAGDQYHLADCLISLANTLRDLGDLAAAEAAAAEALSVSREVGSLAAEAEALIVSGRLSEARGRDDEAASTLRQAGEAAESSREYRIRLLARLAVAEAAGSVADLDAVAADARTSRLRPVQSAALVSLARAQLARGRAEESSSLAEEALEIATPMRQRAVMLEARAIAAAAHSQQGQTAQAADAASAGLDLLAELRRGLDAATLARYLARPELKAFASTAEKVLSGEGREDEISRLRALVNP